MGELAERWRRPGARLAIVALIGITLYFLIIFVKQSVNLYHLTQEVREQEARVEHLRQQNRDLERRLGLLLSEEGRKLLVESSLPYVEPGARVVVPVTVEEETVPVAAAPVAQAGENLAALPVWRQWVQVVFPPMMP